MTTTAVEVHTTIGAIAGQKAETFRRDMEQMAPAFLAALGGDEKRMAHFIEVATTTYLDPKVDLSVCNQATVVRSFLKCAQLGLRPDGKEGAIIARGYVKGVQGKVADFEPMVQGIIRLMLRTKTVKKCEAHVVKHLDDFDYGLGLDPFLRHKPAPSLQRGGVEYVYAIVWLTNGERQFEVVDRAELDKIERLTREQNNGKLGPSWKNYPEEMYRKIAVKRLSKYIEQSPELAAVIQYDDAFQSGVSPDPRDWIPDLEDRSLDERARQHAEARTSELRHAMAENGQGQDDEIPEAEVVSSEVVEGITLETVVDFGKHKGRTIRSLLDEGGRARGYVTHWLVTDKSGDRLTDEERSELARLIELHDDSQADGEDDPQPQGQAQGPQDGPHGAPDPSEPQGDARQAGRGEPPPPPPLWPDE